MEEEAEVEEEEVGQSSHHPQLQRRLNHHLLKRDMQLHLIPARQSQARLLLLHPNPPRKQQERLLMPHKPRSPKHSKENKKVDLAILMTNNLLYRYHLKGRPLFLMKTDMIGV